MGVGLLIISPTLTKKPSLHLTALKGSVRYFIKPPKTWQFSLKIPSFGKAKPFMNLSNSSIWAYWWKWNCSCRSSFFRIASRSSRRIPIFRWFSSMVLKIRWRMSFSPLAKSTKLIAAKIYVTWIILRWSSAWRIHPYGKSWWLGPWLWTCLGWTMIPKSAFLCELFSSWSTFSRQWKNSR